MSTKNKFGDIPGRKRMNKRIKVLVGITVAFAVSIGSVNAASLMDGGPHDLRAVPGATLADLANVAGANLVTSDLCRYCHAPHNSSTTAPLWDRAEIVPGNFQLYPAGGTMAGTPTLAGVSGGCMSCHDGATGFDAVNSYAGGATTMSAAFGAEGTNPETLGTDLSNDHPIGVVLTGAGQMADETVVTGAGLRVFGDAVECASCHDVHTETALLSSTAPNMLRIDPAANEICTVCHLK